MNLKMTLAAAAVAAVAAAPVVSHADATLYGKVQLGLSQAGKTADGGKATTSFFDNGTRFGIKGSDALGSDMTSFYKMEFSTPGIGSSSISSYNTDPGPGMKTRYAYIGAKGGFGTVVGGRVEDLFYSMVEAPTDTPNAIGGSLGPTVGTIGGYVSRVNAVAYVSPDMGGFTGGVAVGNIGTDNTAGTDNYGKQQQVYELGGKYSFGPGYVSGAYISIPKADTQLGGAFKGVAGIAAGYSFGMFGIDGNVTKTQAASALSGAAEKAKKITQATIQGSMTMGALYGYVMYSQAKSDESSSKNMSRVTAGVFYNLSKPLMVSFEVASNNKYTNAGAFTNSGATGSKANTEFAVAMLYNF
jgi:predicted porin